LPLNGEQSGLIERTFAPFTLPTGGSTFGDSPKEGVMQKNSFLRISVLTIPIVLVCGLFGFILSAKSQSDFASRFSIQNQSSQARCSVRTIEGNYAFTVEGMLLLPQGVTLTVRGVSLARYDGRGNMTQIDHVVDNGMAPPEEWTPGSGTYVVNPDCTGTQSIDIPGNPASPIKLHFIVDKGGKEIRQVVDNNAVTAIGSRVD